MDLWSPIQDRSPTLHFIAGEKPSMTTGQEARQVSYATACNGTENLAPIFKRQQYNELSQVVLFTKAV